MNIDDDLLTRSLAQLADDPATAAEARRRSARFAAALRRLHTDPGEAARIAAIAHDADHDTRVVSGEPGHDVDSRAGTDGDDGLPTPVSGRRIGQPVRENTADEPVAARTVATRIGDFLAKLGGANPEVLRKVSTERVKYTSMGGVLLTTAGIAAVSGAVALMDALGMTPAVAAPIGILWGLVILNLDRMLIATIRRDNGLIRNTLTAIPRLALALILGAIISTPLVMKVFEPEINTELVAIHDSNVMAFSAELAPTRSEIAEARAKVVQLQLLAAASDPPPVSEDPDVKAAQVAVDEAQDRYDSAVATVNCELDGTCATGGVPGLGAAYQQARTFANQARADLEDAKDFLASVTEDARLRLNLVTDRQAQQAEAELPHAMAQLTDLIEEYRQQMSQREAAEAANNGLLARVEAMHNLMKKNSAIASAIWLLILLFITIEVLPVLARLLSLAGSASLYDRVLHVEEDSRQRLSVKESETAMTLAALDAEEQIKVSLEVNRELYNRRAEIARKAVTVWARATMEKPDEELIAMVAEAIQSENKDVIPLVRNLA